MRDALAAPRRSPLARSGDPRASPGGVTGREGALEDGTPDVVGADGDILRLELAQVHLDEEGARAVDGGAQLLVEGLRSVDAGGRHPHRRRQANEVGGVQVHSVPRSIERRRLNATEDAVTTVVEH